MRVKLAFLIILLLTAFVPIAPPADSAPAYLPPEADAEIARAWFNLQLELIRTTPGFSPPVAARALGYTGVTLYETAVPGMDGYHSLVGLLNELDTVPAPDPEQTYHYPAAVNSALASITRLMYSSTRRENLALIDGLEQFYAAFYRAEIPAEVYDRSFAYGRSVADAIYNWSLGDGGDQGFALNYPRDYVPPEDQGLWVTTAPYYTRALLPTWGNNRLFALPTLDTCPAAPPLPYSTEIGSPFYRDAREVYDIVRYITPEQEGIALFWADDPRRTATPIGHSVSILNQVIDLENPSLAVAAEAYARLTLAGADAFIHAWHTKYQYNVMRPITYIQAHIDERWNIPAITDPIVTPPFPEYPSGHSIQSAAAMTVLTAIFGENYSFTDITHVQRGFLPRSYHSFWEAAEEAALSRLYGGIHYRFSIEQGLIQGACIGQYMADLPLQN